MDRYISRLDPFHELSFIRVFKRSLLGEIRVDKPKTQNGRWTDLDHIPRSVEFTSMVMHRFGMIATSQKLGKVVHCQNVDGRKLLIS